MQCAKQGSRQVWIRNSASCVANSTAAGMAYWQQTAANDGKQWQTMANDGKRRQAMASQDSTMTATANYTISNNQPSEMAILMSDNSKSDIGNTLAQWVEKVATVRAATAALTRATMGNFYEGASNMRWLWWLDKVKLQQAEKVQQQSTGSSISHDGNDCRRKGRTRLINQPAGINDCNNGKWQLPWHWTTVRWCSKDNHGKASSGYSTDTVARSKMI